ncbi:pilus assembly PilX family protein [Pseudomonas nitroreducens]|uniref:pilus assembly PilX family protein n=1 Tax=Pseudomonas nitroreducens TaxID=46680 RepID=UPI003D28BB81
MKPNNSPSRQNGAVLFVSLIMLLVITVLAISSMRGTVLQERLIGNQRAYQIGAAGAESGLRDAESRLDANLGPPTATTNCSGQSGLCVLKLVPADGTIKRDWSWWGNNDNAQNYVGEKTDNNVLAGLTDRPRWFAAFIGFDPQNSRGTVEVTDIDDRRRGVGPYYYQVNAAARSDSQRVMVLLQSTTVQRY